jgi:hypothetical protein
MGGFKLAAALLLMGAIALIMFVVMISRGQFDVTSLLLAVSLLGLGLLLRRRARRYRIHSSGRGRLLRRLLGRNEEPQDFLNE